MTAADFSAASSPTACPALRGKSNEIKKTKLDSNASTAAVINVYVVHWSTSPFFYILFTINNTANVNGVIA